MFKILLKNLWNRRRSNGWIFAELIIVSFLLCYAIDPVIVILWNINQPVGYDSDRLVCMKFDIFGPESPRYVAAYDSTDTRKADIERIYNRVSSIPGVESATLIDENRYINGKYTATRVLVKGDSVFDSGINDGVNIVNYIPGYRFFETYGIQSVEGSPSPEELSEIRNGDLLIITRAVADLYWPGENACGKRFMVDCNESDTTWIPVKGVVENIKASSEIQSNFAAFRYSSELEDPVGFNIVARLRDGIDPDDFAEKLTESGTAEGLACGNYYFSGIKSYNAIIGERESVKAVPYISLVMILASFFLISLVLGTVGNVWLQTRKRIHEAGILRSFGATKTDIVGMLIGENAILATISVLISGFVYLQFALSYGLSSGVVNLNIMTDDNWISDFPVHFTVVLLVAYAVVMTCVLAGTYMPAHALSRMRPIDALREE